MLIILLPVIHHLIDYSKRNAIAQQTFMTNPIKSEFDPKAV